MSFRFSSVTDQILNKVDNKIVTVEKMIGIEITERKYITVDMATDLVNNVIKEQLDLHVNTLHQPDLNKITIKIVKDIIKEQLDIHENLPGNNITIKMVNDLIKEQIDIHENFPDSGGNNITIEKINDIIKKQLSIHVSVPQPEVNNIKMIKSLSGEDVLLLNTDEFIFVHNISFGKLYLPCIDIQGGRELTITNFNKEEDLYIYCCDGDFFAENPEEKFVLIMSGFTLKIISYLDRSWLNIN
jgi:hypothetical protein